MARVRLPLSTLLLGLTVSATSAEAAGLCEGERERARGTAEHIAREWPLHGTGEGIARYARSLLERLARSTLRDIPWQLAVVRNRAPNAFAVGGGFLYVTDGALTFSENESELAAILAHEMGHQLAGHFSRRERPGFFSWLFWGSDDAERPSLSAVRSRDLGSLSLVIDLAKEQEADREAVALLRSAGYDPHAMLDLARRLPSGGSPSHLQDPRRIQSLEASLARLPATPAPDSEAFRQAKADLEAELSAC